MICNHAAVMYAHGTKKVVVVKVADFSDDVGAFRIT